MHADSRDTGVKNVRHRRRAGDDNFTDVAFFMKWWNMGVYICLYM